MKKTAFESQESSSPIVTRAVASGLINEYSDNYIFPGWQKFFLNLIAKFPQGVGRQVVSRFQTISGLSPSVLTDFSIDDLTTQRLQDYSIVEGKKSCITMGAALGGATTYLSLALDSFYLPQAFVITLKGGSKVGSSTEYFLRSFEAAKRITTFNQSTITIQHFDPVHDGWLTRYVNHLRFKLIALPEVYKSFIKERLITGGSLVYLDGLAKWSRYQVGPRNFFQVGGWGDIPPEEFLSGSDRLTEYSHSIGLRFSKWDLPGFPLETGPESEWGSEPGLVEALQQFCQTEGYEFVHIKFPHPSDFARLAFETGRFLIERSGSSPAGVLIETFSQFDSLAAFNSGLLPLWLIFNTQDDLHFLQSMLHKFPKDKPVFFSPLATFSLTPDMVSWHDWENILKNFNWVNIGTRPSHYPSDVKTLITGMKEFRKWVIQHSNPIIDRIEPNVLKEIAEKLIFS